MNLKPPPFLMSEINWNIFLIILLIFLFFLFFKILVHEIALKIFIQFHIILNINSYLECWSILINKAIYVLIIHNVQPNRKCYEMKNQGVTIIIYLDAMFSKCAISIGNKL